MCESGLFRLSAQVVRFPCAKVKFHDISGAFIAAKTRFIYKCVCYSCVAPAKEGFSIRKMKTLSTAEKKEGNVGERRQD